MFAKTLAHFQELRPSIKAMIYLHWIYTFVGTLTGMFIQIYLYQRFGSVLFSIGAQILFFFGCAIGFSLIGTILSWYRVNMKWGYVWAFLLLCVSFLWLYGDVSRLDAQLFMFWNGVGLGLYWVTLHTFELTETNNHERDYYSSVLNAGNQLIGLIAPMTATLLFFLSDDVFHLGSFTLLFVVSPTLYIIAFPLFRRIRTYRPSPVDMADLRHFFHDKKNRKAQIYLFANSADLALANIVLPIAAIIFLGSEKYVGMWNSAFAIVSIVVLLALSKRRHSGNRLQFLLMTVSAYAVIVLFFVLRFDLAAFVIFTLCAVIIRPLQSVTEHVIDLQTMETLGREGRDFFPTMIFRDAAFGVWRILCLSLFGGVVLLVGDGASAVKWGFFAMACAGLLLYYGASLLYGKEKGAIVGGKQVEIGT